VPPETASHRLRWTIAVLISSAVALSYFDRQTLPVAIAFGIILLTVGKVRQLHEKELMCD
jgi:hypothetical protein